MFPLKRCPAGSGWCTGCGASASNCKQPGVFSDDLYGLSTIPPKNVENTLAQEIQNTPSEQRTARAVQLAAYDEDKGPLASDNPGALLAAASL